MNNRAVIRSIDDLVELVKTERKEQKLTWPELANRSGISQNSVYQWRGLKAGPCLLNAIAMLQALGLRLIAEPEGTPNQEKE